MCFRLSAMSPANAIMLHLNLMVMGVLLPLLNICGWVSYFTFWWWGLEAANVKASTMRTVPVCLFVFNK